MRDLLHGFCCLSLAGLCGLASVHHAIVQDDLSRALLQMLLGVALQMLGYKALYDHFSGQYLRVMPPFPSDIPPQRPSSKSQTPQNE